MAQAIRSETSDAGSAGGKARDRVLLLPRGDRGIVLHQLEVGLPLGDLLLQDDAVELSDLLQRLLLAGQVALLGLDPVSRQSCSSFSSSSKTVSRKGGRAR